MPKKNWSEKFAEERAKRDPVHRDLVSCQFFRSCWNCDQIDKVTEICAKYDAQPPLEVIVFGCEGWSPEIPF